MSAIYDYITPVNYTDNRVFFILCLVSMIIVEKVINAIYSWYIYLRNWYHDKYNGNIDQSIIIVKNTYVAQDVGWNIVSTSISMITGFGTLFLLDHQTNDCSYMIDYRNDYIYSMGVLLVAYFAYDILTHWTKLKRDNLFHHILATIAVSYYYYNDTLYYFLFSTFITEISTIFLSLMTITIDRRQLVYTIIFTVTFFITRLIYMGQMTYQLISCGDSSIISHQVGVLLFCALYLLNTYWFYRIIKRIQRKHSERSKIIKLS